MAGCWPRDWMPAYCHAFAIYDAALRELSIANAGGTLPLLIRGGEVTEIDVRGVPLGLLPTPNMTRSGSR